MIDACMVSLLLLLVEFIILIKLHLANLCPLFLTAENVNQAPEL